MIKTIITKPGELIDVETVFEENQSLTTPPPADKVGRWERVDYTSDVYEDGVVYPKYCNVYLPYCYDPEDKDRKYNVLYYQHGNTCDPELFVDPKEKVKLDALFACEEIEPCIVVAPTYYFDVTKDVEERRKTGAVPAGDGNFVGIKGNFCYEVVKYVIPAVETKYNTYLTDATPEGIIATRDHRCFSGYSRGSVCTWRMFHYCFPYFRWYAPMSGHNLADHLLQDPFPMEEAIDYLTAPLKEHPELPFFIYASNGYPNDIQPLIPQINEYIKLDGFSFGKDPKVNNIYLSISDFRHTDLLAPYYLYNSLQVLFKA